MSTPTPSTSDPPPKMAPEMDAEVLIIGAGPVGLLMANLLSEQRVRIRILDSLKEPVKQWKACVLHSRTQEMLARHDLHETARGESSATAGMNFVADGRIYRLNLAVVQTEFPGMLLVEQNVTERHLTDALTDRFSVQIERGWTFKGFATPLKEQSKGDPVKTNWIDPNGLEVTLTSSYVIGCDGARSVTRKALEMPFVGQSVKTLMAVADVHIKESSFPQPEEAHTFTHPDGMVGFFPFSDPGRVRVIMAMPLPKGIDVDTPLPPDAIVTQETFSRTLKERLKPFEIGEMSLEDVRPFRVNERRAAHFSDPSSRVFLCGDSAHIHSPVGGQGLNIGLQDADNLAWKLVSVLRGYSPPSLLDTYTYERAPIADHAIGLSGKLLRILSFRGILLRLFRRVFFYALVTFPKFNFKVSSKITQVANQYAPWSLWTSGAEGSKGSVPRMPRIPRGWVQPGQRAPEARLWSMPGVRPGRILEYLGATWSMVLFVRESRGWVASLDKLEALATRYRIGRIPLFIVAPTNLAFIQEDSHPGVHVLFDLKHPRAREAWGLGTSSRDAEVVYLVRPDGVVAAASPLDQAKETLQSTLDKVLYPQEGE